MEYERPLEKFSHRTPECSRWMSSATSGSTPWKSTTASSMPFISTGTTVLRRSPRLALLMLLRPICYKEPRAKRVFKKVRKRPRTDPAPVERIDVEIQTCSKDDSYLPVILVWLMVALFAGLVLKMLFQLSAGIRDPKIPEEMLGQDAGEMVMKENFALKSSGASVVRYSKPFCSGAKVCLLGFCWDYFRSPDIILKMEQRKSRCKCGDRKKPCWRRSRWENAPGNCWAMDGSQGYIVIRLSEAICPTAIILDHVSKKTSDPGETSSAPKNFSIYGLKNAFEEAEKGALLGTFIFKTNTFSVQMFQLKKYKENQFLYLMLKILSNHGHPEYTCVYGIRVYGEQMH